MASGGSSGCSGTDLIAKLLPLLMQEFVRNFEAAPRLVHRFAAEKAQDKLDFIIRNHKDLHCVVKYLDDLLENEAVDQRIRALSALQG